MAVVVSVFGINSGGGAAFAAGNGLLIAVPVNAIHYRPHESQEQAGGHTVTSCPGRHRYERAALSFGC
jgi:hypothetical protein